MNARVSVLLVSIGLVSFAAGCVPIASLDQFGASFNKKLRIPENKTGADEEPPPSKALFIGLALSGGGSRAANFSASVMWELHELGLLEHVQYISSVSGSSLPAAYYALFRDNRGKWDKIELQRVMSQCFECWSWIYLLRNPLELFQFLGTSYDRSDVLSRVFNNRVFDQKTFGDLPLSPPRLILNATDYINGERFLFTNEKFNRLKSDLARLPIGDGVMASAAFPGLLRTVTLKDFENSSDEETLYVHLFDGGVNDNIGLDTLLEIHEKQVNLLREEAFPDGCLIILVDAFVPYFAREDRKRPDTRRWYDVVVDSNVSNASSIQLLTKRDRVLRSLGFDTVNWDAAHEQWKKKTPAGERRPIGLLERVTAERLDQHPLPTNPPLMKLLREKRAACKVWHISLTQIGLAKWHKPLGYPDIVELYEETYDKAELGMSYEDFSKKIREVPTRFFITEKNADALRVAAELLVREQDTVRIVCGWLRQLKKDPTLRCGRK